MLAYQVMTKDVITVTPHTSIEDAAKIMLKTHISGLPVVDDGGQLVGIVTESDFLRRYEIGTERRRPSWLQFFVSLNKSAHEFVRERGRKVEDIMTAEPVTVDENTPLSKIVSLMEKNSIKRLPVLSGRTLKGIVTRSNLLQAVASMAHEVPEPTLDDSVIRDRIYRTVNAADWRPIRLEVSVRKGVVHLYGIITTDEARQAAIVAAENVVGVKEVHDHLCFVELYSGYYVESPEDLRARAGTG